jgi:hypothetical protein
MVKVALCFIISYEHKIAKEELWKKWIEPNRDIINIYIHYKDHTKIESSWIKKNALPQKLIVPTDYYHVVPAYLRLLEFGLRNDQNNEWFCFLTDSCVPIISPLEFRKLFFENYKKSIMSWSTAWWNTNFIKRANLHLLQPEYRLGNTPWFVLSKNDSKRCLIYSNINNKIYNLICHGNVANESIFAIMLYSQKVLQNVINKDSTITDWTRTESATSPHLFKTGDSQDIVFINESIKKNKYAIFLRKVDQTFPDSILESYCLRKLERKEYWNLKISVFFLEIQLWFFKYFYYILLMGGLIELFFIFKIDLKF